MKIPISLETVRVLLRPWKDGDYEPFASMNQDPEVMRFQGGPLDRAASDAMADYFRSGLEARGWGFWAIEHAQDGRFMGYTGVLNTADLPISLPIPPCVEIGWKLDREFWGHGYVTEAAARALDFAFAELGAPEVFAYVATENVRSRAVAERLGMSLTPTIFGHPLFPEGHAYRKHLLYSIPRGLKTVHALCGGQVI